MKMDRLSSQRSLDGVVIFGHSQAAVAPGSNLAENWAPLGSSWCFLHPRELLGSLTFSRPGPQPSLSPSILAGLL